ncbi:nuclear intron maturase 3, mitochondrial-like [Hibiscus syriacus]|uniref:nuclear intron maturase 3, mitochondrial-like n=1 Tax=Hibiscus syriacus TaxID=106335 RepID=UPI0019210F4D|nr:nuclear intron maturase 3, mitochondrial-like [Hibiscus syriacus]
MLKTLKTFTGLSPRPFSIPFKPLSNHTLTDSHLKSLVLSQYSHGTFSNLLRNVVASPSVLLTACQNLSHSSSSSSTTLRTHVSNYFSIEEMGHEISHNKFDIPSCCVRMEPPSSSGEPLVLPNLKLKVLIEAIRMVLEIVYDEKFVTFSYGGRVGMGRHTAVRYLKNNLTNPSWWFNVSFFPNKFGEFNVDKLCAFIGEKIRDDLLIDVIKTLFQCRVVRVEFGGCYLGRGLPQESGLCSILINVYLHRFDRQFQEMRLRVNERTSKIELTKHDFSNTNVFYKPVKIYAVRYLDEILITTSGSKVLARELKDRVLDVLERDLGLKVDRVKTAIHSAVSEKIMFLGMELQAVLPSVLHPPMSEKAIRAKKKYLRQKEVKALELRNARERNRKKLGLKILSHVFKKLKQSKDGFKFEYQINSEVRGIFRTWADEVVREFLGSLEERWNWYRLLSRGDFLSLRHVRDQLPQDLVDAYDKFQEQVDKHLAPTKARMVLEEEEKRVREEEEQKYSERMVDDLTKLCMKVSAPIELVRKAVRMAGFTNNMGRPRPIDLLFALEDADIIKWYAGVGRRWLDFFCCCHNFRMVKTVVSYHLRFSCILTLAHKHESTKLEAIKHYSKDLKVSNINGYEEVYFPTERDIKMMGDQNLSDPKPVDGAISLALIRLASDELSHSCVAHFCGRTDTITYRVRLLQNYLNLNPLDEAQWVKGMGIIHETLNRICLPLCPDHINDLYMGKITLQDIDCTSFVELD